MHRCVAHRHAARAHWQNPHFPARRAADVHLDVLDGKDEMLDPADFLPSGVSGESLDIHTPMERKVGL